MIRSMKNARPRALLVLALSAVAVLAVAGLAVAKGGNDSNDDRIPDRWEKRHNLSLKVDQSRRDQDRDGLRNRAEFRTGNDPRNDDSDDDGISDGDEGAGTIKSFDPASGRLVIDLFGGDEISGLVDDRTRIRCEDEHSHDSGHHHRHRGGRDDSASSSRSHGESEPGDDHGDNSGPGSSDDNSGPGSAGSGQAANDDNGSGANCSTADLVVGAVVEEAEIEIEHGKAVFDEVELA